MKRSTTLKRSKKIKNLYQNLKGNIGKAKYKLSILQLYNFEKYTKLIKSGTKINRVIIRGVSIPFYITHFFQIEKLISDLIDMLQLDKHISDIPYTSKLLHGNSEIYSCDAGGGLLNIESEEENKHLET